MSVRATQWEGEDRTGDHGQQQTRFGSNMSTGGDTIDHRCACLGNNWAYCTGVCVRVFGKMSKVDVIEQVNTIWERRHWTRTKAVHLLQRKKLGAFGHNTVSLQPESTLSTPQSVLPLQACIHLLPCGFQTV